MALGTKAWILASRLRRKIGRADTGARERRRTDWVAAHAPGRSFADVGGLFGIHGARAFQAEEAGATEVTLFDIDDANTTEFARMRTERGSRVRAVRGDLEDPVALAQVGPHDIVWSTGVIYHSPNPVLQLMNLREITGEYLYLGTHTIPELPGVRNGCVYYPMLDDASRSAYAAAHYRPEDCVAIGTPFDDTPLRGHVNFWWGITPSALRAMLATARFEVVETWRDREHPFYMDLVARPVDRDPIMPPPGYFRELGESQPAPGSGGASSAAP